MNREKEQQALEADELIDRQNQFATLFVDISPEQLRGLKFCHSCQGADYEWTDWSRTDIGGDFFDSSDKPNEYRWYLKEICCPDCEGTGFEGGSWSLETEEWLNLGSLLHRTLK